MPGDGAPSRQGMQRIPHLPGMAGKTGEGGHLAIGRYPPGGNPPHEVIYLLIFHQRESGPAFHPAGEEYEPGHDSDATDPGGYRVLLFY